LRIPRPIDALDQSANSQLQRSATDLRMMKAHPQANDFPVPHRTRMPYITSHLVERCQGPLRSHFTHCKQSIICALVGVFFYSFLMHTGLPPQGGTGMF